MAITITSITPSSGTVNGGQSVTIRGTGFPIDAIATIGGNALVSTVVVSDNEITGVTPSHASGVVDIEVTGGDD